MNERKNMQPGRNYTDGGKPKHSEKNHSRYHFVHQEFHIDWKGVEPGSPRYKRQAGGYPP
jgi:hypothetical protein